MTWLCSISFHWSESLCFFKVPFTAKLSLFVAHLSCQSRLAGVAEKCRNSSPCRRIQFSASSAPHKNSLFKSGAAWLARYLNCRTLNNLWHICWTRHMYCVSLSSSLWHGSSNYMTWYVWYRQVMMERRWLQYNGYDSRVSAITQLCYGRSIQILYVHWCVSSILMLWLVEVVLILAILLGSLIYVPHFIKRSYVLLSKS